MTDNYARIVENNLEKLYGNIPADFEGAVGAAKKGDEYFFRAFGKNCRIAAGGIYLDGEKQTGVTGILISLYALGANPAPFVLTPFKAFKEFPGSMPYVGAFASHTEQWLVPHVPRIKETRQGIIKAFGGADAAFDVGGDFSFTVYPLPKIALTYIFYEADEDFPASVTCLFSNNANRFMPMDGLADVGEYTSKKIVHMLASSKGIN